ncbi:hypothetical protein [Intrasporangium oryzae]|uniref:hypothetical protein n=1 Tax=Intrasporangium oryzae TaxID=412687 RepID=UPI0012FAE481|nr:hypothetical protein [Intrasporangium oryzae]
MSDFGFVDEAPGEGEPGDGPTRRRTRRPGGVALVFTVLAVGLVVFGAWAWLNRLHGDDLAAWDTLSAQIDELDRSYTPLGHSEVRPCRDEPGGTITRQYPESTGPQAAELIGYLVEKGWVQQPEPAPPLLSRLTMTTDDHALTIEVSGPALNLLVGTLTARSPGSALGCLGH